MNLLFYFTLFFFFLRGAIGFSRSPSTKLLPLSSKALFSSSSSSKALFSSSSSSKALFSSSSSLHLSNAGNREEGNINIIINTKDGTVLKEKFRARINHKLTRIIERFSSSKILHTFVTVSLADSLTHNSQTHRKRNAQKIEVICTCLDTKKNIEMTFSSESLSFSLDQITHKMARQLKEHGSKLRDVNKAREKSFKSKNKIDTLTEDEENAMEED